MLLALGKVWTGALILAEYWAIVVEAAAASNGCAR